MFEWIDILVHFGCIHISSKIGHALHTDNQIEIFNGPKFIILKIHNTIDWLMLFLCVSCCCLFGWLVWLVCSFPVAFNHAMLSLICSHSYTRYAAFESVIELRFVSSMERKKNRSSGFFFIDRVYRLVDSQLSIFSVFFFLLQIEIKECQSAKRIHEEKWKRKLSYDDKII